MLLTNTIKYCNKNSVAQSRFPAWRYGLIVVVFESFCSHIMCFCSHNCWQIVSFSRKFGIAIYVFSPRGLCGNCIMSNFWSGVGQVSLGRYSGKEAIGLAELFCYVILSDDKIKPQLWCRVCWLLWCRVRRLLWCRVCRLL